MVLVLAERYGFVPPAEELSATHQEYREARTTKPVFAFVRRGMEPEPGQAAFIAEVEAWERGVTRGGYDSPETLQDGITRALHDFALATAVGAVDERALIADALAALPDEDRNQISAPTIDLAVCGGPAQRILRPVEIEDEGFAEWVQQSAMFGEHRIFERTKGMTARLVRGDLIVEQERGAGVRVTERGTIIIRVPLGDRTTVGRGGLGGFGGSMAIIEEDVRDRLSTSLSLAAAVLERVDGSQRLTQVGIAARISGAGYRAWRTAAQMRRTPIRCKSP